MNNSQIKPYFPLTHPIMKYPALVLHPDYPSVPDYPVVQRTKYSAAPKTKLKFGIDEILRAPKRGTIEYRAAVVQPKSAAAYSETSLKNLQSFLANNQPPVYTPFVSALSQKTNPVSAMNLTIEGSAALGRGLLHGPRNDDRITEDSQYRFSWLQCTRYKPPKIPMSKLRQSLPNLKSPIKKLVETKFTDLFTVTNTCSAGAKKQSDRKRKLGRNPRIPFSQEQVAMLEARFRCAQYLSSMDVVDISIKLNLTENRVKIWFQNRRARERREKASKKLAYNGLQSAIGQYPRSDVSSS